MALPAGVPEEILTLNVGGSIYTTSRATLTRYPDSMLGSMFSGRLPSTIDECNRYIIDGDGPTFRHILNFLRRSKLVLPDGFQEWDILSAEADYYQLQGLIKLINETRKRIRQSDNQDQPDTYEFVEVYLYAGPLDKILQIVCKPELIKQSLETALTDLMKVSEGHEWRPLRDTSMTEYFGYSVILKSAKKKGLSFGLNRMKLFRDITNCGFTLTSMSSVPLEPNNYDNGPKFNIRDKWTFSRKEVAKK